MVNAELTFVETLWVTGLNVALTAVLVSLGAAFVVTKVENSAADRRQSVELDAARDRLAAEATAASDRQTADALAAERRQQADAAAAERRQEADAAAAERRLERETQHEALLHEQDLRHQVDVLLRETYVAFLGAQRRSRQASLELAEAGGAADHPELLRTAVQAHDSFIELYHRLSLDAPKSMWWDARALRDVLDDMLSAARSGDTEKCRRLLVFARHARQNLEGSFREVLGHEPLQPRKDVGIYEKSR